MSLLENLESHWHGVSATTHCIFQSLQKPNSITITLPWCIRYHPMTCHLSTTKTLEIHQLFFCPPGFSNACFKRKLSLVTRNGCLCRILRLNGLCGRKPIDTCIQGGQKVRVGAFYYGFYYLLLIILHDLMVLVFLVTSYFLRCDAIDCVFK